DISVEKKWNNAGGETTPVTVKLLPTNKTVELNEGNDWKATFKDLDVYDEKGEEIAYDVEELDVDGYNSTVDGNDTEGFVITNTETVAVSGTKTWLDNDSDERPDQITVKLLANGEKVATEKVTADSDWKYKFTDLDKYDKDGEKIEYTIDEVKVEGYETVINGYDIQNVRSGKTYVNGEKTWKDIDETDRQDEIKVKLTREVDGELDEGFSRSKTVEPNSNGDWKYVFTDLDQFTEKGIEYTYKVEEADIPSNYRSEVDGYDITNIRIGKTEISGK